METTARRIYEFTERMARLGVPLLLLALALMAVAFLAVLLIADALQPAAEPIIAAPYRWFAHR
jgi:hypothetical protein